MKTGQILFSYTDNGCIMRFNGQKAAYAGGLQYDRAGTCLGRWLEETFQRRLKMFFRPEINAALTKPFLPEKKEVKKGQILEYNWTPIIRPGNGTTPEISGATVEVLRVTDLKTNTGGIFPHIELDGGVGFDAMKLIAEQIGIEILYAGGTKVKKYYSVLINLKEAENAALETN